MKKLIFIFLILWPNSIQPVPELEMKGYVFENIDTSYNYSINLMKKYETFAKKSYQLFGDEYIGYGHLLYAKDSALQSITELQADSILRCDFKKAIAAVERYTNHIPDNRKMVLALFAFNCGTGTLYRSTLLELVNQGAPDSVIKAEYYKYIYADGRKLPHMLKRRIDEFKLWK
jgi:lysozyme